MRSCVKFQDSKSRAEVEFRGDYIVYIDVRRLP